jgi:SAM-dependent methyltransferase
MEYRHLVNPSVKSLIDLKVDAERILWSQQDLLSFYAALFSARSSEAAFRTLDLRSEITDLVLQGSRDVYVWDEMNKMSEMNFIIDCRPLKQPIVDLCCGYGYWITKTLRHIDLGIDLFPETGRYRRSIEGIRDRNFIDDTYLAVLQCDVTQSLPLPDACVNTILCICALEHIREYGVVLDEVRRILRPGGRFIMTVDAPPLLDMLQDLFKDDYCQRFRSENQLESLLSLNQWREELARRNFTIQKVQGYVDPIRTYLFLMTFYPDGFNSCWKQTGFADLFKRRPALRSIWNDDILPWLTKPVAPEEAMLLCFDCTTDG